MATSQNDIERTDIMNYKLYLIGLIAFLLGRISKEFKIYIGPDKKKYDNATIGILTKE